MAERSILSRVGATAGLVLVGACAGGAPPSPARPPTSETPDAAATEIDAALDVTEPSPPAAAATWTPATRLATIEGAKRIVLVSADAVWIERNDGLARVSKGDGRADAFRSPYEYGAEDGLVEANGWVYRATSFVANAVGVLGIAGTKRVVANKTPNFVTTGEGPSAQTVGAWSYILGYPSGGGPMLALDGGLGLRKHPAASACGVFWVGGVMGMSMLPDGWIVRATPGHAPKTIVRGERWVTDLRADGDYVVWTTDDASTTAPGAHGALKRARCSDGSSKTTIAAREEAPSDVAIDATHVYWSSGSAEIRRVPKDAKDSTAVETFAKLPPKTGDIIHDATHVYYLDASSKQRAVMRIPKSGGNATPVMTDVHGYFLAGDYIYGWRDDTLVRGAKDGKGGAQVVIARDKIDHDVAIDGEDVYFLEHETLMKAKTSPGAAREPRPSPPTNEVPAACTGADIDLARALASPECRVDPAEKSSDGPVLPRLDLTPSVSKVPAGKDATFSYSIMNDHDEPFRLVLELRGDGRVPYAPRVWAQYDAPMRKKGQPAKSGGVHGGYWPRGKYPCPFGESAATMMHVPPYQMDAALARGFVVLPPHGRAHGTVTWQPVGEKWVARRTPDGGCFAEAVTEPLDPADYSVNVSFENGNSGSSAGARVTLEK